MDFEPHPWSNFERVHMQSARDLWQRPEQVVEVLGLTPGQMAADLGAGGGYFVPYLRSAIAPHGGLFLVDRQPFATDLSRRFSACRGVTTLCQDVRALELPTRVNALLASGLVHQLAHQSLDLPAALRLWAASLLPGARVVIVDYHRRSLPVGPPFEELVDEQTVVQWATAAGYCLESRAELPHQYLLSFRRFPTLQSLR